MDILIKDLPSPIKAKALERQREQGNPYNEELVVCCGKANGGFTFHKTKEGIGIWNSVTLGNFQPFYDFHGIKNGWVPKEGEMVQVSDDNQNWYAEIFVAVFENKFVTKSERRYADWKFCRKIITPPHPHRNSRKVWR